MEIHHVWLSKPKRFEQVLKSLVYDDLGTIQFVNKQIYFTGKNEMIHIDKIEKVSLVRPKFSYGNFLYVLIFTLGLSFLFPPLKKVMIPWSIFCFFMFLFLWTMQKWIKLEYNGGQVLYISDSSGRGWKGMFGGTKSLFYRIEEVMNIRV